MSEFWFRFSAYNEQTRYGYGTELQASEYEDKLNWSRVIKYYRATKLTEREAAELQLEQSGEAFNIYEELAGE